VQADGKILVAGYTEVSALPSSNEAFVLRFNSSGTLDTSFGSGGAVILPPQHVSTSNTPLGEVAVEPSGDIVMTGFNQLALLHADGSFDPTFGTGGIAPGGTGSVAIEPNGAIVTAVTYLSGQVNRFLPNGTPDTTFGSGGTVTAIPGGDLTAFALQPDGKIDVTSGFAVYRLLPSEPQLGSFTSNQPTPGGSVTLTTSNSADGNPGSNITQVSFYYVDGNGNKVTLGTGTQANGIWTLTINLPPGTYTLFAQAEDSYGVFGDPLALNLGVL
jgi:uncharacterized delta-60 repeat protein